MGMNLEIKKLIEKWEYIQGGLYYIDELHEGTDSLDTAAGELKHYINTLSSVQPEAAELIDALKLKQASLTFADVPESFRILLKQDIEYLKEDPADLDEAFGSMAIIAFYRHVLAYLNIPSEIPSRMKKELEDTVHSQLPDIRISW